LSSVSLTVRLQVDICCFVKDDDQFEFCCFVVFLVEVVMKKC